MNEPYQNYLEMSIVHFMAYPEVIRGDGPILETFSGFCEKSDYNDTEYEI